MVAVETERPAEAAAPEAPEPARGAGPRDDALAARREQRGRSARQYVLSLRSAFLASTRTSTSTATSVAEGPQAPDRPPPQVVQELHAIFSRYEGPDADWTAATVWDDAFAAERLIVEVLDEDALEVELERRILEARDIKEDALAEFYAGRKQKPADGSARLAAEQVRINRSLLARLTRDLQWHYGQHDLKRRYSHEAQERVVWTFMGALVVFVLVMVFTFAHRPPQETAGAEGVEGAARTLAQE